MFKPRTRTLCIAVAALLLGAAAITGTTSGGRTVTASAVVNAPVIRIASPFDGRVVEAPPARGVAVRPGDTLVRVEATAHDGDSLDALRTRLAASQRQHAAIERHAKALTAARAELKTRLKRYRDGAIARLTAQLKEAEALNNIYKARQSQSNEALQRQERLKARGYASQANFDAATASANIARNDLAASGARIERIRVELDAARKGVFIDGRDDVPYSQQRDDEIMLRLVDLRAQAQSLDATIGALEQQFAAENKRVAATETFRQTADVTGLVWDATSPKGAPVRAGDPLVNLLDCSRPYIEVALDDAASAGIHAGDSVRVRLPDVDTALKATVRSVRGAPAVKAAQRRADAKMPGRVIVRVDLPNATDAKSMQAFCHVGRVAQVTFNGPSRAGRSSVATPAPKMNTPLAEYAPTFQHHVRTARN